MCRFGGGWELIVVSSSSTWRVIGNDSNLDE